MIKKICKFDKKNICQSKTSGGHQNTIFSIDKKYCGKVLRNKKKLLFFYN